MHTPALQAFLIQIASFLLVLALAFTLPLVTGWQLVIGVAALVQGAVAASLSRWCKMAPWWLAIQFFFPISLLLLHALNMPPSIFLAAFIGSLTLFWTTFRTQVPFYPSGPGAWQALDQILPQTAPFRIIDIGSGFGGLVMHLAARYPASTAEGIEVAPLPWLSSRMRAWLQRSRARFLCGDYHNISFSDYDVVFAYLSPVAMPALWEKAAAEMRQGTLLLSYEFPIPGVEPDIVQTMAPGKPALYGWRF